MKDKDPKENPGSKLVLPNQELLDLYEIYRKRIEHEDNLVNHRTSWFITLQAFLFTSVALVATRLDTFEYAKFVTILALVGLVISATTMLSVLAAHWAISGAVFRWKNQVHDRTKFGEFALLPAVAGSGAGKFSIARGKISSFIMPLFIALAWVLMLLLVWTDPCDRELSGPFRLANTCMIQYAPAKAASSPDFVPPIAPGF